MMTSELPRRRTLRWQGFDYGSNHAYFITLCTANRLSLFGSVDPTGVVHRSAAGQIVTETSDALPTRFPSVHLDAFVARLDHTHGILTLEGKSESDGAPQMSLLPVVNALKSISAIAINRSLGRNGVAVWQRSFHDRVIRDDEEFAHLCWYIEENPVRWARKVAEQ